MINNVNVSLGRSGHALWPPPLTGWILAVVRSDHYKERRGYGLFLNTHNLRSNKSHDALDLHLVRETNAVSPQWHHGRRNGIASMEEDKRSQELQLLEAWKPSVNKKERERKEEECIVGEHCPVTSSHVQPRGGGQ